MKTVNCHDNPFDVRPAVNAFIDRVLAIKEKDPKAKIVLFCGEEHTTPIHAILQIAILTELKNHNLKTSYGAENPHNIIQALPQTYPEIFNGITIDYKHQGFIQQEDPNGEIATNIAIMTGQTKARALVHQFCIDNNIKTAFNDIAKTELRSSKHFIDGSDPLTRTFLQGNKELIATSNEGFTIRNKFIVERILQDLGKNDHDIIVQQTGTAHVLGMKMFLFLNYASGQNSLSNIFQSRILATELNHIHAIKIIPIVPDFTIKSIPRKSFKDNVLLIDGLSSKKELGRYDEVEHIKKILQQSGGLINISDLSDNIIKNATINVQKFYRRLQKKIGLSL